MEHFSKSKTSQSHMETIRTVVQEFHAVIEHKDLPRLGKLLVEDVFVFGSAAEAVYIGRDQFIASISTIFERLTDVKLHLQCSEIKVGECSSGTSAWFFDRIVVEILKDNGIKKCIPVRFTGLMVQEQDWQLAAAYWSIPLRSNEYQYSLLQAGKIPAGIAIETRLAPAAEPLANSIINAIAQPHSMPDLYSSREDAVTVGSTVDEIFFAEEGKNFVGEIVHLPLKFSLRGGIRGVVSSDGLTAWMATHIDLSGGLTVPYRFFYVWLREQEGWRIVISHDAVSIDPCNPGFDAPLISLPHHSE
jgi:ketosteroid isomerase-like protein